MKLPVDLRSDTVTRPTPAMRRAIAEAEVGDDVFGEDPTILKLEAMTAELLGKEAALFVPSGTMGNEIALRVHATPGQEVIVEEYSHIMTAEGGAPAALSGLQLKPLPSEGGRLDADRVMAAVHPKSDPHIAPTGLVCVENTHNRHGGRIYPAAELEALGARLKAGGLPLHMDGARLWNAAVALKRPPAELARPGDSVMVCYSKGLGAPVGSAIAGSREFIHQAWYERKRFGGGMRQAGILAAACLYGLEHHRDRLEEDHARARRLVDLASPPPDVSILGGQPETNIVIFLLPPRLDVQEVKAVLRRDGVLLTDFGPGLLRAVTHLDVDDEQVDYAGRLLRQALAAPSSPVGSGAR